MGALIKDNEIAACLYMFDRQFLPCTHRLLVALALVLLLCCEHARGIYIRDSAYVSKDDDEIMACLMMHSDYNMDGVISTGELKAFLNQQTTVYERISKDLHATSVMDACDADHDGMLSRDELEASPTCLTVQQMQGIQQYICNRLDGVLGVSEEYKYGHDTIMRIFNDGMSFANVQHEMRLAKYRMNRQRISSPLDGASGYFSLVQGAGLENAIGAPFGALALIAAAIVITVCICCTCFWFCCILAAPICLPLTPYIIFDGPCIVAIVVVIIMIL